MKKINTQELKSRLGRLALAATMLATMLMAVGCIDEPSSNNQEAFNGFEQPTPIAAERDPELDRAMDMVETATYSVSYD